MNHRWLLEDAYALWRHRPVEAVLGVIGIVAGVAGVVAMTTIGAGARAQVLQTVADLGATTIIVRSIDQEGLPADRSAAVARLLGPTLRHLVPVATGAAMVVGEAGRAADVPVIATNPIYRDLHRLTLNRGRFLAWSDIDMAARVCVLGHGLAQKLYAHADAIGRRVQVEGEWLTVVGVLAAAEQNGTGRGLGDVSRALFRPVRNEETVHELVARFNDDIELGAAGVALHRIVEFGAERQYEYVLPIEIARNKYRIQMTFGYVMSGMSALLLVVGGVSIANAMLLNVVRRAQEIGLRRAVGATRRAILLQFLTEAALVSLFGGIVGIAVGLLATTIAAQAAQWPVAWAAQACLLGAIVSIVIGVISGAAPAWRAAQLDPKVCLSRS